MNLSGIGPSGFSRYLNFEYSFVVFDPPEAIAVQTVELSQVGVSIDDTEQTLSFIEKGFDSGFSDLDELTLSESELHLVLRHPESSHLSDRIHNRRWERIIFRSETSNPDIYSLSEMFRVETKTAQSDNVLEIRIRRV
jgi:hypothetical protein